MYLIDIIFTQNFTFHSSYYLEMLGIYLLSSVKLSVIMYKHSSDHLVSEEAMADVDLEPLLEATADGDWIAAEAARLAKADPGLSLLSLVERLGPVLTSTNTASRVAGVGLLTAVLDTASLVDKLEAKELSVLFMFYIDG